MSKQYFPGQRIRVRGEQWQITGASSKQIVNGGTVWQIYARGLSGIVRDEEYCFLDDLDEIEILDPADIVPTISKSKHLLQSKLYLEAHLRRLLPRNGAIYLGQHGAFNRMEYQLRPAAKALNMIRPRILIADAVGLGKTIECGILLSELIRRGKAQRILCALPQATLEQFQTEMWARFSIPFHRLDSKGLQRLRQDLPSAMNPFYHFDKAIISIDTLKNKTHQHRLENCKWDVVVIDECHNVANRTDGLTGAQRHKVAVRLTDPRRTKAVILMSATPHDGTARGFSSLIELLDPTAIASDEKYTPEEIQPYFIRRTRASVQGEIRNGVARKQELHKIPLKPDELNILQHLHDVTFQSKSLSGKGSGSGWAKELFKTTLIKSFLSSPQALKATCENKLKRLEKEGATNSGSLKDIEVLTNIVTDIDALKGPFSRFEYLKQILKKHPTKNDDRLVIFTERIATMNEITEYLLKEKLVDGEYLSKDGDNQPKGKLVVRVHSSNDVDLQAVVKAFQNTRHEVHILIATNIASEGLNLHHNSHRLIHFDLPWSFITLEQRNGRIDRYGQEKQPEINYFASVAGTKTREADPDNFRDDFWVVRKLEARMNRAGEDMDEEALSKGFTNGDAEETSNTEAYESGKISQSDTNVTEFSELDRLAHLSESAEARGELKVKRLPSFFDKSPEEFVRAAAKELQLEVSGRSNDTDITVSVDTSLKHEVERWPVEFRPTECKIKLEPDSEKMQKHYDERRNSGYALEKSFLNEIHPSTVLLENAALSLFKGNEVPVVLTKHLKKGGIAYLIQGSLFNKLNEVAFQTWQVITYDTGKPASRAVLDVDPVEPHHTESVVTWLKECVAKGVSKESPTELDFKRAQKLASPTLDEVRQEMKVSRKKRAEGLLEKLKTEKKRIEAWEKQRKIYLEKLTETDGGQHGGIASRVAHAKRKLETLGNDSKAYNAFVQDVLATSDEGDVQVLAIFVGAE